MKTNSNITLLVLLLPMVVLSSECNENCGSCGLKGEEPYCFICQNGKKWEDGACSTPLSDQNCLLHSAAGCLTCKEGTMMGNDQKCIQPGNPIQFCLIGTEYVCQICSLSYPSEDRKKCNRALIDGDHCVNGTTGPFGRPACMLCEPGWVSVEGICQSDRRGGCMYMNRRGICVQCLEGFYMRFTGVCDKVKATLEK